MLQAHTCPPALPSSASVSAWNPSVSGSSLAPLHRALGQATPWGAAADFIPQEVHAGVSSVVEGPDAACIPVFVFVLPPALGLFPCVPSWTLSHLPLLMLLPYPMLCLKTKTHLFTC